MKFRILLAVALAMPASSALAQLTEIYSADFTAAEGFVDGVNTGNGWEAQNSGAAWAVTDSAGAGFVSATGSWQRSRLVQEQIAASSLTAGTQIGISATLNVGGSFTASGDFFRIGLAGIAEHAGANMPQLGGDLGFDGTNITLNSGDGTLASVAYASGDVLELDLIFTRGTSASDWALETTLNNVTQTLTSGAVNSVPLDRPGNINPSTLHDYITAGDNTLLGFRNLNNAEARDVNIDSLSLSISADAVPGVDGDYNGNELVDGGDFLLWQQQFGQTGPGLDADGTGSDLMGTPDEVVDGFDLTFWQNNYNPGTFSAATIPEPSSLVLLFFGLAIANRRGSPVRTRC